MYSETIAQHVFNVNIGSLQVGVQHFQIHTLTRHSWMMMAIIYDCPLYNIALLLHPVGR